MDIKKYLTNKEIQLTEDDINLEKLEKDIRKGYVLSEEVDKARDEAIKEENAKSTEKYTELEQKLNTLDKNYSDIETRNTELTNTNNKLKLEMEMVSFGFEKKDFEEVAKMRNTLYSEEKDDSKAIEKLKEKYSATYFPKKEEDKKEETNPNDPGFGKNKTEKDDLSVSRKTSVKDLFIKK